MLPAVVSVEHTGNYRLRIRFDDGVVGEIDIAKSVEFKGVFAPLSDPAFFGQVTVDSEAGTIVWPNGADLDPLVLHSRITGIPVQLDGSARRTG